MPAAEAKKAEGASDDTRLTPRPPFLTGRLHGLNPLAIGEVGIGDSAETFSEQNIKLRESRGVHPPQGQ